MTDDELTAEQAQAYWHDAFGTGTPYALMSDLDVIGNLKTRGAEFARVVAALEESMPWPSSDVMHAVEERLVELAEEAK